MKLRDVVFLGIGVIAGAVLVSQKDSKVVKNLRDKVDRAYLNIRELELEDVKDKFSDIKIEIVKLDAARSKEIINEAATNIKNGLVDILDSLQKNKKIKPGLEKAIDSSEKAVIDLIDYIDDNDLVDKTVNRAKKTYYKTGEYVEVAKDKVVDLAGAATGAAKDKTGDIFGETKEKANDLKEKSLNKVKRTNKKKDLD